MIFILTGDIGIGKTTSLMRWASTRHDVSGILTPRNSNGTRCFLDVKKNIAFDMEAKRQDQDIIEVGRYKFLKSSFKKANDIIINSIKHQKNGYVIIDELGKLELKNQGLHKSATQAIRNLSETEDFHLILVVRSSLLNAVINHYRIESYIKMDKTNFLETL